MIPAPCISLEPKQTHPKSSGPRAQPLSVWKSLQRCWSCHFSFAVKNTFSRTPTQKHFYFIQLCCVTGSVGSSLLTIWNLHVLVWALTTDTQSLPSSSGIFNIMFWFSSSSCSKLTAGELQDERVGVSKQVYMKHFPHSFQHRLGHYQLLQGVMINKRTVVLRHKQRLEVIKFTSVDCNHEQLFMSALLWFLVEDI